MLKRALLLILGAWLFAASGLAAHAGPCLSAETEFAAPAMMQDHCDTKAAMGPTASGKPSDLPEPSANDSLCCCPGMLAAVPAPDASDTPGPAYRLAQALPADTNAPSRALIPEPPPPKA